MTVAVTQEGGSINEKQSVGWTVAGSSITGTYTLTHNGQTTTTIAWNATAATIQTALEALSTIGSGNVLVALASPNSTDRTLTLTFRNSKAATNVPQTTIDVSGLVDMYSTATGFNTTTVTGGVFSEVQTIALANASSGTWRLAYNGEITAPLSPSITATQLKTALDGFVGIDNVSVTGNSGSFTLTFGGTQALTNVSQVFGDAANATNGSTTRTITTAYNAADELTSLSDPSSTMSYTRDNLGRALTIANTVNGLTPTVTFYQTFDSASNRTELKATSGSANDFKNTYQYDALQRLTDIVQESQSGGNAVTSKHVTLAYNALSQRTNLTRYQSTGTTNGVATTDNTYDTINRLSTLTHKQGTTTLAGYTYAYDGMSRPTSVDSTIEGVSTFTYDATSQVTAADHATQTDETYGFDANGNRNSSGYTNATNNQTTAGLGFTYTYDDEGNRLTRTETSTGKVQSYEWDYRNRLVTVKDRNTSGGSIVKQINYEYDAFNRLVRREYDADGAGSGAATNQYWVYDEGINAVLQFDGSAASTLAHRYLWSNQVDELLADEQVTSLSTAGNTLWGLADHLGTLRDIADFNEGTSVTSVTNHRKYNAFGKLTSETNSAVDMLFGYTGKQLDEATGLQHNLNRWYDSNLGKWLSEDPTSFAAGDANLNRYVGNRPIIIVDPNGLDWLDSYAGWYSYNFGYAGQVATSAAEGVVVGAIVVGAVTVAAPLFVSVGAAGIMATTTGATLVSATTTSTAFVTGTLLVVGSVGAVSGTIDCIEAGNNGDWERVAFNLGTFGGGIGVGGLGGGRYMAGMGGRTTAAPRSWNPWTNVRYDIEMGLKPSLGFPGVEWLGTAPTPFSGSLASSFLYNLVYTPEQIRQFSQIISGIYDALYPPRG